MGCSLAQPCVVLSRHHLGNNIWHWPPTTAQPSCILLPNAMMADTDDTTANDGQPTVTTTNTIAGPGPQMAVDGVPSEGGKTNNDESMNVSPNHSKHLELLLDDLFPDTVP